MEVLVKKITTKLELKSTSARTTLKLEALDFADSAQLGNFIYPSNK